MSRPDARGGVGVGFNGGMPAPQPATSTDTVRVTTFVSGWVQGVGFRWWVRSRALELGLSGHARNCPDGRVEVVAQGPMGQVARLLEQVGEQPSTTRRPGSVDRLAEPLFTSPRPGSTGFVER